MSSCPISWAFLVCFSLLMIQCSISSINAADVVYPGLTIQLYNTSDCSVQNGQSFPYSSLNRYNLTNYYPASSSGDCTYNNPPITKDQYFWVEASCTSASVYVRAWSVSWSLNTTCPSLTSNSSLDVTTITSSGAREANSCTAATIQFDNFPFRVYAKWQCVDVTVNNNTTNSASTGVIFSVYIFITVIGTLIAHELMF